MPNLAASAVRVLSQWDETGGFGLRRITKVLVLTLTGQGVINDGSQIPASVLGFASLEDCGNAVVRLVGGDHQAYLASPSLDGQSLLLFVTGAELETPLLNTPVTGTVRVTVTGYIT